MRDLNWERTINYCMYCTVLCIGVLEVPFSQGLYCRKFDSAISADDHYVTSAAHFFSSKLYSYFHMFSRASSTISRSSYQRRRSIASSGWYITIIHRLFALSGRLKIFSGKLRLPLTATGAWVSEWAFRKLNMIDVGWEWSGVIFWALINKGVRSNAQWMSWFRKK